jgi:hypothetical protein
MPGSPDRIDPGESESSYDFHDAGSSAPARKVTGTKEIQQQARKQVGLGI